MNQARIVLSWLVPALSRIVFGFVFWLEGTQKLFGWWSGSPTGSGHPEPFLNWPYWWAGVFEVVIGSALVVGLRTRLFAILGAGTMAYAYFFTHVPERWNWEPLENGGAFAVVYCWAFLLLAATPTTRWSADRLLRSRRTALDS
ncbi:DoxX family protein [Segniliparus rugosus]|uniref:DoxX family protein n=1 Tax=Segniliparus rugosus (strain ATCC BAA-974 / DSM 45345 / CCUG 50838 / CIP 108380 / JCM 13579 / CDC 945) TaxID=679197 RepID=E5XV24_SEGRC|nr:DoxX family protein [Segniliparus rugosus]EFV11860.1 hypothetical protein HMPREF9336_03346 [Segniliparus rugosus ATCC BAA-974]